ncbi:gp53-like domain-containing protein [Chromobacterium violaceum]|uniref:gp53-like domain-containing protein n=1 Tax=Chromobacterium violaceum TaxID=536 RepID=UPI0015FC5765|nr:hypothetical protein [Chromobacterium violaceum]MBA8735352.1 hypothetical protein [Chromobacterium violaceum]
MRRVGDNRNPVRDKFGPGKHGFGPGDPQTGQPATTPGYELFDSWQEEMASVVEGAGVALKPDQNNQLLQAIRQIARLLNSGEYMLVKNPGGTSGRILGVNPAGQMVIGDVDNIAQILALQAGGTNVATADGTGITLLQIPKGPTAVAGTNSKQLATTEFVQNAKTLMNNEYILAKTQTGSTSRVLGINTAGQLVFGDIDNIAKILAIQVGGTNVATADGNGVALLKSPTAPTPPVGDNSTRISTTAFVQASIAALVSTAPDTLDTLKELADALGNDPNFATTMTNTLAGKLPRVMANGEYLSVKNSTGASGRAIGINNNNQFVIGDVDNVAKSIFIQAGGANAATIDGNGFSFLKSPSVPTQPAGSNNKFSANTEFVQSAISGAMSALVGPTGYQLLGGGYIIQMGTVPLGRGLTSTDIVFPIAFSNQIVVVFAVNNSSAYAVNATNVSLTGMTVRNSSTESNSGIVNWIVCGK